MVELTSPFLSDPEILSDFLKTSKVVDSNARSMVAIEGPLMAAMEHLDVESISISTIEDV